MDKEHKEQQWGFSPFAKSIKKREPETPSNSEPKIVNNYFTVMINPQAVLLLVLLIVVAVALFRVGGAGGLQA